MMEQISPCRNATMRYHIRVTEAPASSEICKLSTLSRRLGKIAKKV